MLQSFKQSKLSSQGVSKPSASRSLVTRLLRKRWRLLPPDGPDSKPVSTG
jgi:hypothetical protein